MAGLTSPGGCYIIIVSKKDPEKEVRALSAKELLNLIDWLRRQGFEDDKIIECLESVEGRKKILSADSEG